jgi:hypothetical protein
MEPVFFLFKTPFYCLNNQLTFLTIAASPTCQPKRHSRISDLIDKSLTNEVYYLGFGKQYVVLIYIFRSEKELNTINERPIKLPVNW